MNNTVKLMTGMTSKNFSLPQVQVALTSNNLSPETSELLSPVRSSCLLLVLGGRAPDRKWLRELCNNNSCNQVWAIDSGTDACRLAGIIPDRVIGDLDSISSDGREWAIQNGVLAEYDIYPTEKDDTDFQIALKLGVQEHGPCDFIVTGCWGGRFDHAFYSVLTALQAREVGANVLCMADDQELLVPLDARKAPASVTMHFTTKTTAISLLPLSERATGVTITGVYWPLTDVTIPNWKLATISNVLCECDPDGTLETNVTISAKSGALGVYAVRASAFTHEQKLPASGSALGANPW